MNINVARNHDILRIHTPKQDTSIESDSPVLNDIIKTLSLNNEPLPLTKYIKLISQSPALAHSPHQRLRAAIEAVGRGKTIVTASDQIQTYNMLEDPLRNGIDAVYGADQAIKKFVNSLENEGRLFVFYGPNSCGKSSLVRLIKHYFTAHTKTKAGTIYELGIKVDNETYWPPRMEDPLLAIPEQAYQHFFPDFHIVGNIGYPKNIDDKPLLKIKGQLLAETQLKLREALSKKAKEGPKTIEDLLECLVVRAATVDEYAGLGIGTFRLGKSEVVDEKKRPDQQTITRDQIANIYNRGHRGLLEIPELGRVDKKVLDSIITAAEEHRIIRTDGIPSLVTAPLISHTTTIEYQRLTKDPSFRDRIIGIEIPYNTRHSESIKLYQRDFNSLKYKKHIAPEVLNIAAAMEVLSHIIIPQDIPITKYQKLQLYDDQKVGDFGSKDVKRLRNEFPREAMSGIRPRELQNIILSLLGDDSLAFITPADLFKALRKTIVNEAFYCCKPGSNSSQMQMDKVFSNKVEGSKANSQPTKLVQNSKTSLIKDLNQIEQIYNEHIARELKRLWTLRTQGLETVAERYIELVSLYNQDQPITDSFTGNKIPAEEADNKLMDRLESQADIDQDQKASFRAELGSAFGAAALEGKKIDTTLLFQLRPEIRSGIINLVDNKGPRNTPATLEKLLELAHQDSSILEVAKAIEQLVDNLIEESTTDQNNKYPYTKASAKAVIKYLAGLQHEGKIQLEQV